jgi:hypothetical protein
LSGTDAVLSPIATNGGRPIRHHAAVFLAAMGAARGTVDLMFST